VHGASLSFSNAESLTPISQDGLLALFDTNIGILQGVRLTLFGTGSSTFTLTNNGEQPGCHGDIPHPDVFQQLAAGHQRHP
jgi:hypothetical protein